VQVIRRSRRRGHGRKLHLLLLSHLVLLFKHGSLLSVHLLLHETTSLAIQIETVGCGRDLVAGRVLLMLVLIEIEILLLRLLMLLGVCLLHRRLVHGICAIRHANHRLVVELLLSAHGSW